MDLPEGVELPDGIAGVLAEFGELVRPLAGVTGLYAGGSVATGDYQPAVSDLDLMAVIDQPLSQDQRTRLAQAHREFIEREPRATRLHCVYVPLAEMADVGADHVTWAVQQMFERSFSGIARAELLRYGFAVFGPPPAEVVPEVTEAALREAVKGDLSGYWGRAVRKRRIWLLDVYVDLGLITLARAEAALADGSLITKRDAMTRLPHFGVPPRLVEEMRQRRSGQPVQLAAAYRVRRGWRARRLVARGIDSLLNATP